MSYGNQLIQRSGVAMLALMLLAIVAGCGGQAGLKEPPIYNPVNETIYRIGETDTINIEVWKNPELSVGVVVRPDGMISLPLVGDVLASGKTTDELSADITKALSDYVRTPQVTVIVVNPASAEFRNRVRVTGAVNQQTSIPYKEGMRVLDVILTAGGLTEFAAANRALLYRKNAEGVVTPYEVRLKDILDKGQLDTNYLLQPSDIITVPERNF